MKKLGSGIIIFLNIVGIMCLIYYAVPYIMHDTSIPNPDAMLPMQRWEGAGIMLTIGAIPLLVANLIAFLTVWKEKIKKPLRFLLFLPGLLCSILAILYWLPSDKTDPTLDWLYEKGEINVIWGDVIYSKDDHAFHGDGSSLVVYHYTDSSMEPEMEKSKLWKKLPFSGGISDLIKNSIGDECAEAIPDVTNGYYFYYDRHKDAADPYDESELWNRSSINCTVAIYDTDEDIMYIFKKDT